MTTKPRSMKSLNKVVKPMITEPISIKDRLVIDIVWLGDKRIITFEDGGTEEKMFEGEVRAGGLAWGSTKPAQKDRRSSGQVRATGGR